MEYRIEVPAEEKIAKHALLEAIFGTELWAEPYVKNPFIYITDHESDFAGDEGKKLETYFRKVFLQQYRKYKKAIEDAVPEDLVRL
mgnify:CR=1 FL=1